MKPRGCLVPDRQGEQFNHLSISDGVRARRSIRAFLPNPVSNADLRGILDLARWAPSGSNMQPWRIDVLTDRSLRRYSDALLEAAQAGQRVWPQNPYGFAAPLPHALAERRRNCGFGLYSKLGIDRLDRDGRKRVFMENYRFFGAPAYLLVWFPNSLPPSWLLDVGAFLQTFALAAVERNFGTIIQGAVAAYPEVPQRLFGTHQDHTLVAGVALGSPDTCATINDYQPDRKPIEAFARWLD